MTSYSESFWSSLISSVGAGRREPTDAELERLLDGVEDVPVRPEVIERMITRAVNAALDGSDAPALQGSWIARHARVGGLLLLAACGVSSAMLWDGRNSTLTLELEVAIVTASDEDAGAEQRNAAIGNLSSVIVGGLRALKRVAEEDPPLGPDARLALEELVEAWRHPDRAAQGSIDSPFPELARFLLDRGNDIDARREAIGEVAGQVRAAMLALRKIPADETSPERVRDGFAQAVERVNRNI